MGWGERGRGVCGGGGGGQLTDCYFPLSRKAVPIFMDQQFNSSYREKGLLSYVFTLIMRDREVYKKKKVQVQIRRHISADSTLIYQSFRMGMVRS